MKSDSSPQSFVATPVVAKTTHAAPRNLVGGSVRRILALTLAAAAYASAAQAQAPADDVLEEVIVTGSSIRSAEAAGALPVQVFDQEDIARSGVTSVTDFVQQLPAMQGFAPISDSVGGTGGGVTNASIHDVGAQYTLVLLNGRRVAPSDSGTTIDLNTIPLSAVERIEVLTDGASAIYGADAIAGVVNFILKSGAAPLTLDLRGSAPEHGGAEAMNFALSKGFGDLASDGYEAFFSVSYDKYKQLRAVDRPFASTGIIQGTKGDITYDFFNGSSRSIPPNVDLFSGNNYERSFSPYLALNGDCPPAHVDLGDGQCFFDYTTTIEIAPAQERKALFASGKLALGDSQWSLFSDLALVSADTVARIAPYPAEFGMSSTDPLFQQYVTPFLSPAEAATVDFANVKYRLYDMGNRTYDYSTESAHFVLGIQGSAAGWDLSGSGTISTQKQEEIYLAGFPLAAEFEAAIAAGEFDPFPYAYGEMPADQVAALRATQYTGLYNTFKMDMLGFETNAQRELFDLSGGRFVASFGADYRDTGYKKAPAPIATSAEILFDSPQPSFDLSRQTWGAYGEFLAPVLETVDVTGAVRYDSISGVDDSENGVTFGGTESEVTYKLGVKWQPIESLALRASYGTGFRAATMREIAQPQVDFGVTGGTFNCPFSTAYDPLGYIAAGYLCPANTQYEVFQSGNANLKPETSVQWNAGLVWSPLQNLSVGVNYWSVEIEDAVEAVSESLILNNAPTYLDLYTTKFKESNGLTYVAILDAPINIGKKQNEGIDWDISYSHEVGFGRLIGSLAGTHLIESRYTLPGTSDQWTTSLGQYGVDDEVSFDDIINASLTLQSGNFETTVLARYKSGYEDIQYTAADFTIFNAAGDPIDGGLTVPSYTIVDWRGSWNASEVISLGVGVDNVFDKDPPLTLRFAGSHQLGYDPRYASAFGRTYIANIKLTF